MLKKRIIVLIVISCILLTGCSFEKTDTSDLRALGLCNAASEIKRLSTASVIADQAVMVSDVKNSYYYKIDRYLASLGTTLEDARKQAEQIKKEEAAIVEKNKKEEEARLEKLKNEEDAYLETIRSKNREWDDLAPTTHMSFEELVGDNGIYEYPEAFATPDTYKIIVDLKYQVVMVYAKDKDGEYTVPVRYMLCSSGADKTQSPVGAFEMKDYRVRFSRFVNTENFGQYWSLITGRIYFHSILYDSKNASDYITSTWNNLGKNVSHGCIRLSVPDARFIYYNMAPGTIVQIRKGSSSDTETKEIRDRLLEGKAKAPSKRIEIKAGDIPCTDNWAIEEIPHLVPFVQGHQ
ncbi:MAG: L,D-transpeptidase [Lachnospiraceae bacterium]|nr:L,D-transpeptidase [Lachnospiraceae bacterium]